ncbi:hypothetical protein P9112_010471 [Eukaryota sp. TZLM1-RC]
MHSTSSTSIGSKPLLLEYVPKLHSFPTGGVLLITFSGSVNFLPLDDIDDSCEDVHQISNFSVCSFAIEHQPHHNIASIPLCSFPPTKIEFCSKYKLLLVVGMSIDNVPSITVYHLTISSSPPHATSSHQTTKPKPSLVCIFSDALFAYADVALCHHHPGIAYLLHSSPSLLHYLNLQPYITNPNPTIPSPIGPLIVAGPCTGSLGHVVRMTRLTYVQDQKYQFLTYNDECWGEFQLWSIDCLDQSNQQSRSSDSISWSCHSLFLFLPHASFPLPAQSKPDLLTKPEPTNDDTLHRTYISSVHGCIDNHDSQSDQIEGQFAMLIRREFPRSKNNCFGVAFGSIGDVFEGVCPVTFHRFTSDQANYITDLKHAKWTRPFLLGSKPSFGCLLRNELVEMFPFGHCLGSFLHFSSTIDQFTQIGRYRRVAGHSDGSISLIIAIPPCASFDLTIFEEVVSRMDFESVTADTDTRNFRRLAGYEILEFSDGWARFTEKSRKKDVISGGNSFSRGKCEVLKGLNLVFCFVCKSMLLMPLVCDNCKGKTYCSRECQAFDWKRHQKECKRDLIGSKGKS